MLVNKPFQDIITFTRASAATRINSLGVMESVAANVPRIDYDPVTLAVRGLLIEEQRTNQLTSSNGFVSGWSKIDATVATSSVVAPDGTSAFKLVESATNAVHLINQAVGTNPDNTDFSASIYAKAGERSIFWIESRTKVPTFPQAWFDLNSGVVLATGNGAVAKIVPAGNGWYRCSIKANTETGTMTNNIACGPAVVSGAKQYVGDGVSGVYLWGAQLETGAYPTSYIPTSGAQATRAADVASINTLSPWYNQTEGTLYVEAAWTNGAGSGDAQSNRVAAGFSDGTSITSLRIYNLSGTAGGVFSRIAGVTQVEWIAGTPATAAVVKSALGMQQNNTTLFSDGVNRGTDTACLMVPANKFEIGCIIGLQNLGGHVRKIRYYPKRLTNAELQALTA